MLTVEGAHKVFNRGSADARPALRGLSISLPEGGFAAVIGANGSGKSTLLNAIAGAVALDDGTVRIGGTDVSRWPAHRRAKLVARVFQDPMLGTAPSMTVEENLALAETQGNRRALRLALDRRVRERYRALLARFELGLEDRLAAKVGQLSGGQRQSLSLVMAIAAAPRVLLLDEHCAALDPRTAELVMAATVRAIEDARLTALMVTHNMRQALAHGDRLIMMEGGRVCLEAAGAAKAALTLEGLVERFRISDDRMILID